MIGTDGATTLGHQLAPGVYLDAYLKPQPVFLLCISNKYLLPSRNKQVFVASDNEWVFHMFHMEHRLVVCLDQSGPCWPSGRTLSPTSSLVRSLYSPKV